MGCNTSKEAMASVTEHAEAAAAAVGEAAKGAARKAADHVGKAAAGAAAAVGAAADSAADDVDEYVDPADPAANKAATKIQATYRGHNARRSLRASMAGKQSEGDSPTKQQLEKDFDPNDTELCNAAVKIQSSFRGHMARKQAPKGKPDEDLSRELQKLDAKAEEEELDIDLSDPDLHKAATKIQASFRGHKVRKETEPKEGEGEGGSEGASQ